MIYDVIEPNIVDITIDIMSTNEFSFLNIIIIAYFIVYIIQHETNILVIILIKNNLLLPNIGIETKFQIIIGNIVVLVLLNAVFLFEFR